MGRGYIHNFARKVHGRGLTAYYKYYVPLTDPVPVDQTVILLINLAGRPDANRPSRCSLMLNQGAVDQPDRGRLPDQPANN